MGIQKETIAIKYTTAKLPWAVEKKHVYSIHSVSSKYQWKGDKRESAVNCSLQRGTVLMRVTGLIGMRKCAFYFIRIMVSSSGGKQRQNNRRQTMRQVWHLHQSLLTRNYSCRKRRKHRSGINHSGVCKKNLATDKQAEQGKNSWVIPQHTIAQKLLTACEHTIFELAFCGGSGLVIIHTFTGTVDRCQWPPKSVDSLFP